MLQYGLTRIAGIFKIYARKSGGSFFELNLGVLRILLFPGRAESPMERLALSLQMKAAKRSWAAKMQT